MPSFTMVPPVAPNAFGALKWYVCTAILTVTQAMIHALLQLNTRLTDMTMENQGHVNESDHRLVATHTSAGVFVYCSLMAAMCVFKQIFKYARQSTRNFAITMFVVCMCVYGVMILLNTKWWEIYRYLFTYKKWEAFHTKVLARIKLNHPELPNSVIESILWSIHFNVLDYCVCYW